MHVPARSSALSPVFRVLSLLALLSFAAVSSRAVIVRGTVTDPLVRPFRERASNSSRARALRAPLSAAPMARSRSAAPAPVASSCSPRRRPSLPASDRASMVDARMCHPQRHPRDRLRHGADHRHCHRNSHAPPAGQLRHQSRLVLRASNACRSRRRSASVARRRRRPDRSVRRCRFALRPRRKLRRQQGHDRRHHFGGYGRPLRLRHRLLRPRPSMASSSTAVPTPSSTAPTP